MRLATLRTESGTAAIRVDSENTGKVVPGYADVRELLANPDWAAEVEAANGLSVFFEHAELAPVVPRPSKVICVGMNYVEHIKEMGREAPKHPTLFIKFPEALIGPTDPAYVPTFAADCPDWEGELAVVIGRTARNVAESEAESYIAGYSIINDFTMRDFQTQTLQWHQGKSFEHTAGFGPWLDTDFQPGGTLTTRVNGELMQTGATDDLVFSPAFLVSYLSRIYTLNPGDVIATGTPSGVGHARDPKRYLADGDVVEISIEGIGTIKNAVEVR